MLEDGTRLLANFRYNMRPEDAEQVKKMGGDVFSAIYPTKEYDSTSADWKCDETMIGFAQNAFGQNGGSLTNHRV